MAESKEKEIIKQGLLKRILGRKISIIVFVIVIVGVAGFIFIRSRRGNDIEIDEIKRGAIKEELILSGEINATEFASLGFSSSGKLSWINVKEGEEVKKGMSLARIDSTGFQADLNIADAELRDKAATLDRVLDELKDKEKDESLTEKETRTGAETNKDKAVFSHIKAQNILANATIKAPFDGIITFIANPFAGVNILFSQTQIEIINPQTIFFKVSADQSEVVDVAVGQKVTIVLDSIPDEEFTGEVEFVSFVPNNAEVGSVYGIKVNFLGQLDTNAIRVGMTGDARFILSEKEDVLYVPTQFINSDKDGKYLNISKKNQKIYVDIGVENEDAVEVSGEISEGQRIYDK